MVSSGYMTEITFEGIWDAKIATAQFDLINIRLGSILNYLVTRDAATDVTNTAVKPILEHLSEEALMNLIQGSKSNKFVDVWQFIQTDAVRIMSRILAQNQEVVKMIRSDLGYYKMELTSSRLPSSSTNW